MWRGRNLVGRSSRDDPSALVARSRPDVDDPIARCRDAHVVLDDNNRVSGLHETVQLRHQLRHVRRMQTRRGFVEDVQRFAPLRALQFGGELDALSLAAGKLRGRLSQPDISQADLPEDAQRPAKGGSSGKKSNAPSTVIARTSAIDLSRILISSVLAL